MSTDRQFAVSGCWALASDGLQWILQRRRYLRGEPGWRPVSFVRSTRDILERCMHEAGVPAGDVASLLQGLPMAFDAWSARNRPEPARLGRAAPEFRDGGETAEAAE